MTPEDYHRAAHNLQQHGGHFASAIATAYFCADSINREKLLRAFGELFERAHQVYGGKP